jgi:hypothetical protein
MYTLQLLHNAVLHRLHDTLVVGVMEPAVTAVTL